LPSDYREIRQERLKEQTTKNSSLLNVDKNGEKPTESFKSSGFLDFDKDIEIGDNFAIERVLDPEQLARWKELTDEDDAEDLSEDNLK